MADKAYVLSYDSLEPTGVSGQMTLTAKVAFLRDDTAGAVATEFVPIAIAAGDTLQTRRQKVTAAVQAFGAARTFTLAAGDIDLPDYLKGS
jgi:hypothetical protein